MEVPAGSQGVRGGALVLIALAALGSLVMLAVLGMTGAILVLRTFGPLAGAVAAAWTLDHMCRQRGLMPPGFRQPWRRLAASLVVTCILWIGIFEPLGSVGLEVKMDLSTIHTAQLFLLHILMSMAVAAWFLLGFAFVRPAPAVPPPRPGQPVPGGLPAAAGWGEPGSPAELEPAASEVAPAALLTAPAGAPTALMDAPVAASTARMDAPESVPAVAGADADDLSLQQAEPLEPLPLAQPVVSPLPPAPPAAVPVPVPASRPGFLRQVAAQLGLLAASIRREVGIGILLGLGAWAAVLLTLLVVAVVLSAVGGEGALPKPSAILPWIAALPVMVRILVSLSAGFVEEIFFRGFLQPRVGITLSTAFFVLAHVSYGQPFMLLGITLLSLIFAFLVRWRQTIWPAIAAHALFDGVQLLLIIPALRRVIPS
jgi:membrane protease YdiL (CAAX protease family)